MFCSNVARSMYVTQYAAQLTQQKQALTQIIMMASSLATKLTQQMNNPYELNGPQEQQTFAKIQQLALLLGKLEMETKRVDQQIAAAEAEGQGLSKQLEKDVKPFNTFA